MDSPQRHRDHGVRDFKTFKIRNLVSRDVVVGNHPTPIVGRWTKVGRRSEATVPGIDWNRILEYFWPADFFADGSISDLVLRVAWTP